MVKQLSDTEEIIGSSPITTTNLLVKFGDRLMVGHEALNLIMLVRAQLSEPKLSIDFFYFCVTILG